MATRKRSSSSVKKAAGKVSKWALGKIFTRSLLMGIMLITGGVVFNLDRLPEFFSKNFINRSEAIPDGVGSANQIISGKVISVYDGDTMVMVSDNNGSKAKYKVRFFGIDAPEVKQEYGGISRDILREKLLEKDARIQVINTDRYGRCVCKVYLNDRYINREMVLEGHAWYYPDYAEHEIDLKNAQEYAIRDRRGLWQNRNPMPPWQYRCENNSK